MNITTQPVDKLHAILKVDIVKSDYNTKIVETLQNYCKTATIPGFRKGHVPMGMVRKKYGRAIKMEEIDKLIRESLSKYLSEQKIEYLGYPIPKENSDLDKDELWFEFEIGLKPKFEVNLKTKKSVTYYQVTIEDTVIQEQIDDMRYSRGKIISLEAATGEDDNAIRGRFVNEDYDIDKEDVLEFRHMKEKTKIKKLFKDKKVGERVTLSAKDYFEDMDTLSKHFDLNENIASKVLKAKIHFDIEEVNRRELAELNQELFDTIYGKDIVHSAEALFDKTKESMLDRYAHEADQRLLNDMTDQLIKEVKFDLPEDFLKRWLQTSKEESLDENQAQEEFQKSEKGLRYQLIEGVLVKEHQLEISADEMKEYARKYIIEQLARYGRAEPTDQEINDIISRILTNEEEGKHLYSKQMTEKLLQLYKEKANIKNKKVSEKEFYKIITSN